MGGVPWQFRKFADAPSKLSYGRALENKVAGGFTNSASLNESDSDLGAEVVPPRGALATAEACGKRVAGQVTKD